MPEGKGPFSFPPKPRLSPESGKGPFGVNPEKNEGEEEAMQKRGDHPLVQGQAEEDNAESANQKMRALEVEKEEKEEAKEEEIEAPEQGEGQKHTLTAFELKALGDRRKGYAEGSNLGFDPVDHGVAEDKELGAEQEEVEAEAPQEVDMGRQLRKSRKKLKAKDFLKLYLLTAIGKTQNLLKEASRVQNAQQAQRRNQPASLNEANRKKMESVSTYRHHSLVNPENDAGIFDNLKIKKDAAKQAAGAGLLSVGLDLSSGVQIQEFSNAAKAAAKQSLTQAASPYLQAADNALDTAKMAYKVGQEVAEQAQREKEAAEKGTVKDASRQQLGDITPQATLSHVDLVSRGQGQGQGGGMDR